MTRQRKTQSAIAIALVLIAAGGVTFWSASRKADAETPPSKPPAPAPTLVTTVKASDESVPIYLTGVGTVQANATVTVKVRVDGELQKVGFAEGQDVKAGQVLAEIDPRSFQAQLGQVVAARAKDQAQLDNAKRDLVRYTDLIKQDATTQQTLDTQRALVAQLEAALKNDDAQIEYAKVQLGYTTIISPLSGRTGARLVDPGNIVHATDTTGLVVINQIDPIATTFTLPEDALQQVNKAIQGGKSLKVVAYARDGGDKLATGTLSLVNNQIDTTTGTVSLKGTFPNPAHALWPGQYVNVSLVLGERSHAITLPSAAVQRGNAGTYVYVVNASNEAQLQKVKVAQIQDGKAIIDQGVQAGQRVVLDGQYKLKPGATIAEADKPAASH
ncbi:efflux RND transporter periplasmic adaptor subunit [Silvimonas sp.]|uniref:efflux RND transporter periplasmic adaptor subunit n=1 Tax=Silvimonas sp. TaxID=2650811 RepID=UPI00284B19C8|nr:efflux RND transporter periplasmic adaptor subunit [Silvimonas sp.]MDR3428321.1 efflux RND transporter periplasmic adaptor subunit [Silvimonas sp.]